MSFEKKVNKIILELEKQRSDLSIKHKKIEDFFISDNIDSSITDSNELQSFIEVFQKYEKLAYSDLKSLEKEKNILIKKYHNSEKVSIQIDRFKFNQINEKNLKI